jgi:hypothetical protein
VRDMLYRSDSNWRFTVEEWRALACAGHHRMQLLFHPFQWMAGGRDMREVLALTYAETARAAQPEFLTNHIWGECHGAGVDESIFAAVAKLFTDAGNAHR